MKGISYLTSNPDANRTENNFDFLRFMAAVVVIFTHSVTLLGRVNQDWLGQITSNFYPFSYYGVSSFFIISGYLIAQSLERSSCLLDYLWKRCLRLFPGLIIVVLFTVFVVGPIFTTLSIPNYFSERQTWIYLKTITMFRLGVCLPGVFDNNPFQCNTNGSLWTLAYEFSYYICLILLQRLGIFKKWSILMLLLMVLVYLDYQNQNNLSKVPVLALEVKSLFQFGLYFYLGLLCYLGRKIIIYQNDYFWLCIVGYCILVYIQNMTLFREIQYFILTYIIFYLSSLKSKLNNWGKYGDFSYGIYIYGFIVQQSIIQIFDGEISSPFMIILSLLFVFPFAYFSWHIIEKKALEYKNIFR